MSGMKFNQVVLFDQKHKLCKMGKTKNDNLMGNFNDMFKLLIQRQKKYQSEEFEYVAYLVPVKYEKVDGGYKDDAEEKGIHY